MPDVVAETRDLNLVRQLVLEWIGVAVLPRSALSGPPQLAHIPLARPAIHRQIMLVARSQEASPAGRAFLATARRRLVDA
jgi:DNA-binding transcriptional LysR family regulator